MGLDVDKFVGYMTYIAEGKLTGGDAAQDIPLAKGATHVRLIASGGDAPMAWDGNDATATEPYLKQDIPEVYPVKGGTTEISVYLASGIDLYYTVFSQALR